ncbi:uncharacterized protein TRIADDRAFT_51724 [Trichoplax adhaerens]|uniref:EF-hand domain-containing protein n=1 Tax=Trichoplax adhaerens TaxID=10228 RepID=B3RKQ6_TRIAD|nr:hypothetical protein TRIADDRAFT_51724 [Trichoplax adhaerens]EDV28620.1 hypothetical protein TRIADDRAFT_51724 [Trichoplax adhaerens]|eukprot:XP_002107822.1 hypothetical protein TRIADDRAFT_51724 [Trichoplax adhaerens]
MEDLSTQEMHHLIRQKLQELFSICDPDNQGYITLDDLLVQKDQLSIPSEQMGIIFEALDKDGQGYLTMEAFVDGLSTYLSQNLGGGTQSHGQNEASTDDKEHALPNVENINQEQELTTYRNHNINSLIANAESAIDQEDTVFECDLSGDATTDAEIEEFLSEMGMRNNAKDIHLIDFFFLGPFESNEAIVEIIR